MIGEKLSNLFRSLLARLPFERFRNPPPVVAVLRLSGVIGRMGPMRGGMTAAGLDKAIERAFASSKTKTVALVVNSPGGSPVQSALIAKRIRHLADEKEIPVVAFTEDVAASGGYWLATAGDEIFADENSIVGSIGVVSAGFGFADLLERYGVERRVHTAGRRKAMLDPFRDESPEDVARLKSIQSDVHESFKEQVRSRRGDRIKAADSELFEGDIWTGKQALALGLIDGIGDLRTEMRARFGDKVRFRDVPVDSRGLLRRRLGFARAPRVSETVVADLLAALDEWALWKRVGL